MMLPGPSAAPKAPKQKSLFDRLSTATPQQAQNPLMNGVQNYHAKLNGVAHKCVFSARVTLVVSTIDSMACVFRRPTNTPAHQRQQAQNTTIPPPQRRVRTKKGPRRINKKSVADLDKDMEDYNALRSDLASAGGGEDVGMVA